MHIHQFNFNNLHNVSCKIKEFSLVVSNFRPPLLFEYRERHSRSDCSHSFIQYWITPTPTHIYTLSRVLVKMFLRFTAGELTAWI